VRYEDWIKYEQENMREIEKRKRNTQKEKTRKKQLGLTKKRIYS
jgi:hypothetical protein